MFYSIQQQLPELWSVTSIGREIYLCIIDLFLCFISKLIKVFIYELISVFYICFFFFFCFFIHCNNYFQMLLLYFAKLHWNLRNRKCCLYLHLNIEKAFFVYLHNFAPCQGIPLVVVCLTATVPQALPVGYNSSEYLGLHSAQNHLPCGATIMPTHSK